jgi:CheY-like chemotaxis protein
MKMPKQNGIETLKQIHQLNKNIPVLISSGYTEEETNHYFADKAIAFLPKPFKAPTLIKAIQDAIRV